MNEFENAFFLVKANMFNFQNEVLQYMLAHKYVLNACSMGLGKSLQSIALIVGVAKRSIIICPASLKYNWKQEIEKYSDLTCGFVDKKAQLISDDTLENLDVLIINYEQIDNALAHFKTRPIVVVDECQALKNPEAARTNKMYFALRTCKPEYLILLSGTPIKNRIPELWSYLFMLAFCPGSTNGINLNNTPYKSYHNFCNHFSNPIKKRINDWLYVTTYEGTKNIPELHKLLEGKYIKKEASEVLDLPDFVRTTVKAGKDISSALEEKLLKEWRAYERSGNVVMSTAKKELANTKTETTINLAKTFLESDEKLVIFSDHIESTNTIAAKLAKDKYKTGIIMGSTPIKERNALVQAFQTGDLQVLCLTIGAGSTGLTLTAANTMLFNDLPWVPTDILQAEKRILRIGQNNKCFYYTVTYGKIDAMIQATLAQKLAIIKQI